MKDMYEEMEQDNFISSKFFTHLFLMRREERSRAIFAEELGKREKKDALEEGVCASHGLC
jgi:hypothetical protein